MSNIVFRGDSAISLAEKMRKGLQTLREEKKALKETEGVILLLDVSGSMGETLDDGKRKIDHLRKAVLPYNNLRKVSFSGRTWEDYIPEPQTNTDLTGAFQYLSNLNVKEVILISDGLPDCEESALREAQALSCPVNVIYIGNDTRGERFMKRLAQITKGKEITITTNQPAQIFREQLTSNIKLMLPEGRESK